MKDGVTILISSCDKFADLWSNNFLLFERYWTNHPNICLLTDKKNVSAEKYNSSFCFCDANFSKRLSCALERIETEYVFLTLDDYLISKTVNDEEIKKIIAYMGEENVSCVRLFGRKKIKKGFLNKQLKIYKLPLTSKAYEVNLYPSIWKTSDLKKLIVNLNEDIWRFEVRMTRRARENGFICGWASNKGIYDFVDTVRKGKYLRKAYAFLRREGLYISNRPRRTIRETLFLDIRSFLSGHLPEKAVLFLKK